jgi:hypothetical protein
MRVTFELILENSGEKLLTEINKVKTGPVVITDTMKDGNFYKLEYSHSPLPYYVEARSSDL